MRCVRCDQCQFGMTSVHSAGNVGPACKATGFMTNDEHIAEAVTDTVLADKITSSQRYCVLCDRACEPRDAAMHREWWREIDS